MWHWTLRQPLILSTTCSVVLCPMIWPGSQMSPQPQSDLVMLLWLCPQKLLTMPSIQCLVGPLVMKPRAKVTYCLLYVFPKLCHMHLSKGQNVQTKERLDARSQEVWPKSLGVYNCTLLRSKITWCHSFCVTMIAYWYMLALMIVWATLCALSSKPAPQITKGPLYCSTVRMCLPLWYMFMLQYQLRKRKFLCRSACKCKIQRKRRSNWDVWGIWRHKFFGKAKYS